MTIGSLCCSLAMSSGCPGAESKAQIAKALVFPSFRKPVAFGRTPVSVVGMLKVHRCAPGVVTVRAWVAAWAGVAVKHAVASADRAMNCEGFMLMAPDDGKRRVPGRRMRKTGAKADMAGGSGRRFHETG